MMNIADEVLSRINIVEVVSQYVQLRKTGRNFVGLCPFHKEKTPSFTVSLEKQIFYCFGCNEGGNAINFLMKYDGLTFQETIESLARQYGIKIKKDFVKRNNAFDALSRLAEYYHKNLMSSRIALNYLKARGIGNDIIEEFMIGYSERSRESLANFIKKTNIQTDVFINTGIVRTKEGEIYDIFRGRIVMPIFDVNKKIVGFGGRTIEKDGFPKYINSPESSVFSKGSSLFGIDKARKSIAEKDEVFIVEGYFDHISLYMNGFKNVVSTLGTSVTEGQLSKLRNYTENITLMLDGDEAGIKSALRLIGVFSEMDINGNMVVLPDGHDPDSFLREKGKEVMNDTMRLKKSILDYYFDYCMKKWGMKTLENKKAFIKSVMPHIEVIKNTISRRLYVKRLSELTGVEERYFFGSMSKGSVYEKKVLNQRSYNQIGKKVIGALMSYPELLSVFRDKEVINYIKDVNIRDVLQKMFSHYTEKGNLELNDFMQSLDKDELKSLVLNGVFDVAECTEDEINIIVKDYSRHLSKTFKKEEARKITERLSAAEKIGDVNTINKLLEKKRQILSFTKN